VPCNLAARLSPRVLVANVFFLQSVLTDTAGSNNALWSLANEFWYYIAFPLCILVTQKKRRIGERLLYVIALSGITMLVGKSVCLLFLLWLLGAMVSFLPLRLPPQVARTATGIVPIVLPLSIVLAKLTNLKLYVGQWVVAIVCAAAVYVILHRKDFAPDGLYKTAAGFFSRISYTLYLVHLPLAVFLCAYINHPWRPWSKSALHLTEFFLLDVALIAFSYLFYVLFEANTDRLRRLLFAEPAIDHRKSYGWSMKPRELTAGEASEVEASVP
jgi:peptidoglycan/LPS O-acetylase OafA/YrhL